MPTIRELLLGILLPAVLCGSILSLAWARRGVGATPFRRSTSVVGAFAIAVGYWCATVTFLGSIAVPSSSRTLAARDWLPWMALAVCLAAPLHAPPHSARTLRGVFSLLLAGVLVWLSRGQMLHRPFGVWILALEVLMVTGAVVSTQALATRNTGLASVVPLFVVALATSVASLLSSTGLIALMAGAVCACLGACGVMARWNRHFHLAGAPVAVVVILLGGFWINAAFFSTMPKPAAALFWLALFAPWIAEIAIGGERGSWKHVFWSSACALVPSLVAVLWSHLSAPEPYY